jgi:hypothetical protein
MNAPPTSGTLYAATVPYRQQVRDEQLVFPAAWAPLHPVRILRPALAAIAR